MTAVSMRQITLRLPEPLYLQARRLAQTRRVSINKLAQEGLESLAQQAFVREMQAAYEALATNPAETEVETYFAAQREVVIRDPF